MIVAQERSAYTPERFEPQREKRKRVARNLSIPSKSKLIMTGFVLLCLAFAIFVLLYFANLVKLGYDLGILEKELALLETENQVLAGSVAGFTSLEAIEEAAVRELGMVKPGSGNVMFVPLEVAAATSFNQEDGDSALNAEDFMLLADQEGKSWIIQAFADLVARSGKQQPEVKSRA